MSSQTSPDLPPTGPPPGSAEFLATLLFEESDYSCAHTPKLEPGKESKIPPRLGLFHCTDEDLSYIDTNKLCLACYNAAIPDGFLCWSAFYAKKGRNVFSPDEEYKSGEPTRGNKEFFPRQIQAGKEGFFRKPEPRPGVDTKAAEVAGDLDPNPSSHAYEKRVPSLPPNEDTRTVWRFFEHAKMPFYIDIVHISPPWRGDVGWMRQNKEDLRVGEANAAAYLGAAVVVLAVPEGGDGPYSVVEQRLGTYGSYRLLSLGPWTDDSPAEEASDSEEVTDGKDTKPFDRTNVAEVNPTFYPYQGKEAYRGGVFSFFPDKKICDEVNKKATGTVLPPTVDELLRRAYQKELPKNPTKILLSPGHTSSEPPPDIQPDFPVPRVSDIPLVRWPDAERAAYEKGQGLEGVEVGTAYPVESVAGFAMHKPRFMLKPMYKQSSHGVRSDGSLSADPYDFSGNELNLLPMKCKMDTCNCPDSEGCKVLNKIRTYLKKRRFLDHKRSYVKKPQQPLDPELWRRYQTPHPDPAPTHFSDDDDDLILQALSPPRRPVQTGIFQYPRSWYLANGVKQPDTAEDELIYGTSDDEEEEQPIQRIPAAFINIDSDSEEDLGQDDNNENSGDGESESGQGDSSEDGESDEDGESSEDGGDSGDDESGEDGESSEDGGDSEDGGSDEGKDGNDSSEGGDESEDGDESDGDRPHHSLRGTPPLVA